MSFKLFSSPVKVLQRLTQGPLRNKITLISQRNCNYDKSQHISGRYGPPSQKSAFSYSGEVLKDTLVYSYHNDRLYRNISMFSVVLVIGLLFQSYVTYYDFSKIKPKLAAATGDLTFRKKVWLYIQERQWTILTVTYLITGKHFIILRNIW